MDSGFPVLRRFVGFTLLLSLTPMLSAQDVKPKRSSASAEVASLAPFLRQASILVVRADLEHLRFPILQAGRAQFGEEFERLRDEWTGSLERLRQATKGRPLFVIVDIPAGLKEVPLTIAAMAPAKNIRRALPPIAASGTTTVDLMGFGAVVSSEKVAASIHADQAAWDRATQLEQAWSSVESYPIQAALILPKYARRTLHDLLPVFPAIVGGGSTKWVTDDIEWFSLGVDPASMKFEAVFQARSEAKAREVGAELEELVQRSLRALEHLKETTVFRPLLVAARNAVRTELRGRQFVVRLAGEASSNGHRSGLAEGLSQLLDRLAARRMTRRFQHVALAALNYEQAHKHLPPSDKFRDASGKSNLSWRVYILPYLGYNELALRFHYDESWDSPHNRMLIREMPEEFMPRTAGSKPGHTTLLAVAGPDTILGDNKSIRLSEIADGSSQTVMMVEVEPERSVVWTAPDDYVPDPRDPVSGLHVHADGNIVLVFANASVRRFSPKGFSPQHWMALFHKSDGTVVRWPK